MDISISAFDPSLQSRVIAPDPTSLYLNLSSPYDIVDEDILLCSQSFAALMVGDTNALLRELRPAAFAVDKRLPCWAELWPSSIELARYCLEECSLRGKRVLGELQPAGHRT